MIRHLLFVVAVANFSFAQNDKILYGTVMCDGSPAINVEITNLVNEKSTISNNKGKFSIGAKPDDMLVFTNLNYQYKRKFLEKEDFESNDLQIILAKKIEVLEEVSVSKQPELDAVKLGILEKSAKEYTPAERRLKNAGEFKPNMLLTGLLGLSLPIKPIINAISGKTNNLKSQLEIERNEILLLKIANLYNNEYYIKKLKINPSLIKAFQYYAIYDLDLIGLIKSKNKNKINFRMIELAQNFNKLQVVTK